MIRWLRVVDFETTGLGEDAEAIELAQRALWQRAKGWELVSLTATEAYFSASEPLTAEVRAVHHIDNSDLPTGQPFAARGPETWRAFGTGEAAIVAHNTDYDGRFIDLVDKTTPRLCTYKCALRAWPDAPSHKNQVLRYYLQDRGEWPASFDRAFAEPSHRAGPDAYVTAHLLLALLAQHPLEQLLDWSREGRHLPRCPVGKHKGTAWQYIPSDYLVWMRRSDMSQELKAHAIRELDRRTGGGQS